MCYITYYTCINLINNDYMWILALASLTSRCLRRSKQPKYQNVSFTFPKHVSNLILSLNMVAKLSVFMSTNRPIRALDVHVLRRGIVGFNNTLTLAALHHPVWLDMVFLGYFWKKGLPHVWNVKYLGQNIDLLVSI